MSSVFTSVRMSSAILVAAFFVLSTVGSVGDSAALASSNLQTITFEVELDPSIPGCLPKGVAGFAQILGSQSFTGEFQAHAGWQYTLVVDQGIIQQMSVSISGSGGPVGGYSRTVPPFDNSSVTTSWSASVDGPVSTTVTHIIADAPTYDPDALSEYQTARISVTAVPLDDHGDDAREATVISLDQVISGLFELCTDSDAFAFFAEPGFDYRIDGTIGKVDHITGAFWDVPDIQNADPADFTPLDLEYVSQAGILLQGFTPVRSGIHHFVISGAGNDVNAPYTVKVTRTPITTTVNTSDMENDGSCDEHHCSLPEAIEESNNRAGVQTIDFDISGVGVHRISPQGFLPYITDSVIIDATTQPGYSGTPLVVLDGSSAGFTHGISIEKPFEAQLTVKGLSIVNFERTGVYLGSGPGHTLVSNFIGIEPQLFKPAPNLEGGVLVLDDGGHVIGTPGEGNVIGSNGEFGIRLYGANVGDLSIEGNWIGTNAEDAALGNSGPGLLVESAGTGIVIGGSAPGAGNVFANNTGPGLLVDTTWGPSESLIQGNVFRASESVDAEAIKATLGRSTGFQVGGSAAGEGNTFTGPFGTAVDVKTVGTQSINITYAGNTHQGNKIALHLSESAETRVTINESGNLFEGNGWAIKAELKAAGTKTFGTGTQITAKTGVGTSFIAEPLAGTHIVLALSGTYEGTGSSVVTRGEGTVDIRVDDMTVHETLVPTVGLEIGTGTSGKITLNGFKATNNMWIASSIDVGRFADQPITATVEITNSSIVQEGARFTGNGTGFTTTQSAKTDVAWKFAENIYRNNKTGLSISAAADSKASYDLLANTYVGQADLGLKVNLNPLKNVSIDFTTTGALFDSNLKHAEFDIGGAGKVNIQVLNLTGTSSDGNNIAGLKYHITADVKASLDANVSMRRTSVIGSLGFGIRADIEVPDFGSAFIEANASHFDGNATGAVLLGWKFTFSEEPNTFNDNSGVGIVAEDSVVSITNDTISGNGTGIIVRNGSEVEIANNSISGNAGDGLFVESTQGAVIGGNSITGNGGAGVVLGPGVTALVTSNTFDGNAGGDVTGEGKNTADDHADDAAKAVPEIRSAVLTPSGDLEITYVIADAERLTFPLSIAFMNTNGTDDSTLFTSVAAELFESPGDAIGSLQRVIPNAQNLGIAVGDNLVVSTIGEPNGGTSEAVMVTAETSGAATEPPEDQTQVAQATVNPENTVTPESTMPTTTVEPTATPAIELSATTGPEQVPAPGATETVTDTPTTGSGNVGEVRATESTPESTEDETPAAGSCGASSGAATGADYVLIATLMVGLVMRRRSFFLNWKIGTRSKSPRT